MFAGLGKFVARRWYFVIVVWVALLVGLRLAAPRWSDITYDGDLAYLPADMPSVVGERLLEEAFPGKRSKSQVAVFVAREAAPLTIDDFAVAYDLGRRFKNLSAAVHLRNAQRVAAEAGGNDNKQFDVELSKAGEAIEEALHFDASLQNWWNGRDQDEISSPGPERPMPFAEAYFNRSLWHQLAGRTEQAAEDRRYALELDPDLADRGDMPLPDDASQWPLLDAWTWRDQQFGKKLGQGHEHVCLILLQLTNEFMATDNIRVLEKLEATLADVRRTVPVVEPGLQVGYSGSAAVGGDMLRAAQQSIKHTELFTVLLVVLILGFVYRSPLLVVMPMITITVALLAACSLVAWLTQLNQVAGFEWWSLKVFTTTKIFIVVILFGAGTDYFLFLVARYKEELERGRGYDDAITHALASVGDALAASALTTILGLSTMFFADFGKFSNSGPVIGLCLAVTLIACITLAPALLRAFGPAVFWPLGVSVQHGTAEPAKSAEANSGSPRFQWLWRWLADAIVARPGLILVASLVIMSPLAVHGFRHGHHVTYDLLSQLPADRPSKQGAALMARHFPVGEGGPVTVVVHQDGGQFDTKEGRQRIGELGKQLYVDGVVAVRNIADPLGEFPPGRRLSIFNLGSWKKLISSPHPRSAEIFVAQSGPFAGNLTRMDVVLDHNPFSVEAEQVVQRIDDRLAELRADPDSAWHGATFALAGTTAGIRDLKAVTQSDNHRIEMLVVLAVFAVLLVILRRPLVCVYMIATVLFSFYVTIGLTEWFFGWTGGADFQGLDWKVPLFLFVILVAIGQDYNVYLATRVFEEQRRLGPLEGLRYAVVRTGGIITSCGVIMAGTFISMTSGTWTPLIAKFLIPDSLPAVQAYLSSGNGALPGIVQLGFALSLGVMLDTFIVRPILVPAFFAVLSKRSRRHAEDESTAAAQPADSVPRRREPLTHVATQAADDAVK